MKVVSNKSIDLSAFREVAKSGKGYVSCDNKEENVALAVSQMKPTNPDGNSFMRTELFKGIRKSLSNSESEKTVRDFIDNAEKDLFGGKNHQSDKAKEALDTEQLAGLLESLDKFRLQQSGDKAKLIDDWVVVDLADTFTEGADFLRRIKLVKALDDHEVEILESMLPAAEAKIRQTKKTGKITDVDWCRALGLNAVGQPLKGGVQEFAKAFRRRVVTDFRTAMGLKDGDKVNVNRLWTALRQKVPGKAGKLPSYSSRLRQLTIENANLFAVGPKPTRQQKDAFVGLGGKGLAVRLGIPEGQLPEVVFGKPRMSDDGRFMQCPVTLPNGKTDCILIGADGDYASKAVYDEIKDAILSAYSLPSPEDAMSSLRLGDLHAVRHFLKLFQMSTSELGGFLSNGNFSWAAFHIITTAIPSVVQKHPDVAAEDLLPALWSEIGLESEVPGKRGLNPETGLKFKEAIYEQVVNAILKACGLENDEVARKFLMERDQAAFDKLREEISGSPVLRILDGTASEGFVSSLFFPGGLPFKQKVEFLSGKAPLETKEYEVVDKSLYEVHVEIDDKEGDASRQRAIKALAGSTRERGTVFKLDGQLLSGVSQQFAKAGAENAVNVLKDKYGFTYAQMVKIGKYANNTASSLRGEIGVPQCISGTEIDILGKDEEGNMLVRARGPLLVFAGYATNGDALVKCSQSYVHEFKVRPDGSGIWGNFKVVDNKQTAEYAYKDGIYQFQILAEVLGLPTLLKDEGRLGNLSLNETFTCLNVINLMYGIVDNVKGLEEALANHLLAKVTARVEEVTSGESDSQKRFDELKLLRARVKEIQLSGSTPRVLDCLKKTVTRINDAIASEEKKLKSKPKEKPVQQPEAKPVQQPKEKPVQQPEEKPVAPVAPNKAEEKSPGKGVGKQDAYRPLTKEDIAKLDFTTALSRLKEIGNVNDLSARRADAAREERALTARVLALAGLVVKELRSQYAKFSAMPESTRKEVAKRLRELLGSVSAIQLTVPTGASLGNVDKTVELLRTTIKELDLAGWVELVGENAPKAHAQPVAVDEAAEGDFPLPSPEKRADVLGVSSDKMSAVKIGEAKKSEDGRFMEYPVVLPDGKEDTLLVARDGGAVLKSVRDEFSSLIKQIIFTQDDIPPFLNAFDLDDIPVALRVLKVLTQCSKEVRDRELGLTWKNIGSILLSMLHSTLPAIRQKSPRASVDEKLAAFCDAIKIDRKALASGQELYDALRGRVCDDILDAMGLKEQQGARLALVPADDKDLESAGPCWRSIMTDAANLVRWIDDGLSYFDRIRQLKDGADSSKIPVADIGISLPFSDIAGNRSAKARIDSARTYFFNFLTDDVGSRWRFGGYDYIFRQKPAEGATEEDIDKTNSERADLFVERLLDEGYTPDQVARLAEYPMSAVRDIQRRYGGLDRPVGYGLEVVGKGENGEMIVRIEAPHVLPRWRKDEKGGPESAGFYEAVATGKVIVYDFAIRTDGTLEQRDVRMVEGNSPLKGKAYGVGARLCEEFYEDVEAARGKGNPPPPRVLSDVYSKAEVDDLISQLKPSAGGALPTSAQTEAFKGLDDASLGEVLGVPEKQLAGSVFFGMPRMSVDGDFLECPVSLPDGTLDTIMVGRDGGVALKSVRDELGRILVKNPELLGLIPAKRFNLFISLLKHYVPAAEEYHETKHARVSAHECMANSDSPFHVVVGLLLDALPDMDKELKPGASDQEVLNAAWKALGLKGTAPDVTSADAGSKFFEAIGIKVSDAFVEAFGSEDEATLRKAVYDMPSNKARSANSQDDEAYRINIYRFIALECMRIEGLSFRQKLLSMKGQLDDVMLKKMRPVTYRNNALPREGLLKVAKKELSTTRERGIEYVVDGQPLYVSGRGSAPTPLLNSLIDKGYTPEQICQFAYFPNNAGMELPWITGTASFSAGVRIEVVGKDGDGKMHVKVTYPQMAYKGIGKVDGTDTKDLPLFGLSDKALVCEFAIDKNGKGEYTGFSTATSTSPFVDKPYKLSAPTYTVTAADYCADVEIFQEEADLTPEYLLSLEETKVSQLSTKRIKQCVETLETKDVQLPVEDQNSSKFKYKTKDEVLKLLKDGYADAFLLRVYWGNRTEEAGECLTKFAKLKLKSSDIGTITSLETLFADMRILDDALLELSRKPGKGDWTDQAVVQKLNDLKGLLAARARELQDNVLKKVEERRTRKEALAKEWELLDSPAAPGKPESTELRMLRTRLIPYSDLASRIPDADIPEVTRFVDAIEGSLSSEERSLIFTLIPEALSKARQMKKNGALSLLDWAKALGLKGVNRSNSNEFAQAVSVKFTKDFDQSSGAELSLFQFRNVLKEAARNKLSYTAQLAKLKGMNGVGFEKGKELTPEQKEAFKGLDADKLAHILHVSKGELPGVPFGSPTVSSVARCAECRVTLPDGREDAILVGKDGDICLKSDYEGLVAELQKLALADEYKTVDGFRLRDVASARYFLGLLNARSGEIPKSEIGYITPEHVTSVALNMLRAVLPKVVDANPAASPRELFGAVWSEMGLGGKAPQPGDSDRNAGVDFYEAIFNCIGNSVLEATGLKENWDAQNLVSLKSPDYTAFNRYPIQNVISMFAKGLMENPSGLPFSQKIKVLKGEQVPKLENVNYRSEKIGEMKDASTIASATFDAMRGDPSSQLGMRYQVDGKDLLVFAEKEVDPQARNAVGVLKKKGFNYRQIIQLGKYISNEGISNQQRMGACANMAGVVVDVKGGPEKDGSMLVCARMPLLRVGRVDKNGNVFLVADKVIVHEFKIRADGTGETTDSRIEGNDSAEATKEYPYGTYKRELLHDAVALEELKDEEIAGFDIEQLFSKLTLHAFFREGDQFAGNEAAATRVEKALCANILEKTTAAVNKIMSELTPETSKEDMEKAIETLKGYQQILAGYGKDLMDKQSGDDLALAAKRVAAGIGNIGTYQKNGVLPWESYDVSLIQLSDDEKQAKEGGSDKQDEKQDLAAKPLPQQKPEPSPAQKPIPKVQMPIPKQDLKNVRPLGKPVDSVDFRELKPKGAGTLDKSRQKGDETSDPKEFNWQIVNEKTGQDYRFKTYPQGGGGGNHCLFLSALRLADVDPTAANAKQLRAYLGEVFWNLDRKVDDEAERQSQPGFKPNQGIANCRVQKQVIRNAKKSTEETSYTYFEDDNGKDDVGLHEMFEMEKEMRNRRKALDANSTEMADVAHAALLVSYLQRPVVLVSIEKDDMDPKKEKINGDFRVFSWDLLGNKQMTGDPVYIRYESKQNGGTRTGHFEAMELV